MSYTLWIIVYCLTAPLFQITLLEQRNAFIPRNKKVPKKSESTFFNYSALREEKKIWEKMKRLRVFLSDVEKLDETNRNEGLVSRN